MALLLDKCVILHVPKTGTTWVRQAVDAAVDSYDSLDKPLELCLHYELEEIRQFVEGRPVIAFVRQPVRWLESFWAHRRKHQNKFRGTKRIPLNYTHNCGFRDFVTTYLQQNAGWYTRFLERYVGVEDDPVRFIGRTESLVDDLCGFFDKVGQDYDEEALRECPRVNECTVGARRKGLLNIEGRLKARVHEVERGMMQRFGYV